MEILYIIIGAAIGVIASYLGHPWYIAATVTALVMAVLQVIKYMLAAR